VREVTAPRAGAVAALGAIAVGNAALHLGAGRRTKTDEIDHAVGVVCRAKRGDEVAAGDVLAEVHARTEAAADEAARDVLAAYELGDKPPPERRVLLEVLSR
jgi:pyrimidine-nucleoside phosphorylase